MPQHPRPPQFRPASLLQKLYVFQLGRHLASFRPSTTLSAGLGTFYGGMWMYLALGFSVLIAFNVLIAFVGSVVARHTEPRDELDAKQRARLLTYVR